MKECSVCGACFEDRVTVCSTDGETVGTTLKGGVILADKYLLNRRLGQGGMGTVYQATQINLQRNVAIKIMTPNYRNPNAKERFHREALAIARLKHPNIVSVYDFGFSEDGYAYLVMEFIAGFQLRHLLDRWPRCGLEFGIDICRQICEAISMAHTYGVLHRDLKPENVMFEGLMSECIMKVVDFGLAKLIADQAHQPKLTSPNMIIGTYNYMSPEQCRGEEVDERSDIYGLGILFYEMFVGRPPFLGIDPLEIMELHLGKTAEAPSHFICEMPPKLEELIMSALNKERDQRPQTAREMAKVLSELLIAISEHAGESADESLSAKAELLKAQSQLRADYDMPHLSRELHRCKFTLEHNPEDTNLRRRVAELYQEAGRVDEAIEHTIVTADLLSERGDTEQAVFDYLKVRNLGDLERRAAIANRLVKIYLRAEKFAPAYQQCRQLIHYYLAHQRFEEAEEYLLTLPLPGEQQSVWRGQLEKLIADAKLAAQQSHTGWRRRGSTPLKADLSDQTVLIVDPDPLICYQLARLVRKLGAHVELASTAEDTQEIIKRRWPTLIIFELTLPDLSGSELYRKLNQSGLAHETAFVCLSSLSDSHEIDAAFANGINDYWLKPLNLDQISTRLKQLLLQSRYRTQLIGRLNNHPLIEVIKQLELSRRTGRLAVKTGAEKGRIHFVKGMIVDAELNALTPIGALYRMLGWDEGRFHFRPEPAIEKQALHISHRELMLAALNLFDEERRIVTQFPSLSTMIKLTLPEMIMADDREQEVLRLFDGTRAIGELFEQLRGDLVAMRTALALYRTNRESTFLSNAQTVISDDGEVKPPSNSRIFTRRLNEATLKRIKSL